jgi:hypothetical protein
MGRTQQALVEGVPGVIYPDTEIPRKEAKGQGQSQVTAARLPSDVFKVQLLHYAYIASTPPMTP